MFLRRVMSLKIELCVIILVHHCKSFLHYQLSAFTYKYIATQHVKQKRSQIFTSSLHLKMWNYKELLIDYNSDHNILLFALHVFMQKHFQSLVITCCIETV